MATLSQIYAPVPLPVRAQASHIGGDPKGENVLYCVGNSVVTRSINDVSKSELYQQHAQNPTVARYAPSRFYIASADSTGKVRIWDTTQEEHILKNEFHLLSGPILDMAWTDDSKRLAVVGQGKEVFGSVISADTGARVGEISGHSKAINSVDIKPNRPYRLVTGSEDFNVSFFEGVPFKFVKGYKVHERFVNCVRFSPNGEKFVSVSSDKMAFVFDGKTGDQIGQLPPSAHGLGIYGVAWAPDSSQFVTVSADKTAKLWDASSYTLLKSFELGQGIEHQQLGCIWSGGYIITVSLSGFLTLIDPESGSKKVIRGHNKLITALAYDSDSKKIYSADFGASMLEWDVDSAETDVLSGPVHTNQISGLAIAQGNVYSISMDDSLKISSLASRQWGPSIPLDIQPAGMAVSNRRDVVIVVGGSVILVIEDGKIVSRTNVNYPPLCVALTPLEDEIAVGGKDSKVHVYSLNGPVIEEKYHLEGSRSSITCLAYSCEGILAVGDGNRELILWKGQERLVNGWVFHTTRINSVAWSPDGIHIASIGTDSNLVVWNRSEPTKRIMCKNAHYGGGTQVTWIDDNTVLTGGQDCALKAWKLSY